MSAVAVVYSQRAPHAYSSTESVVALDPSSEVIAVAQEHARKDPLLLQPGRLEYRNYSIEDLPLPNHPWINLTS